MVWVTLKKLNFIFLIFLYTSLNAQEIKWENFSYGISGEYQINQADWEEYWGSASGLGLVVNYGLSENIFLEGSLIYSKYDPKDDKRNIPEFGFIKVPVGLIYKFELFKQSNLNTRFGLVNNTFMFEGEAAEIISENSTESEMGVYIGCGVEFNSSFFDLEVYLTFQNIFSEPENLKSFSIGGKILF